MLYTQKVRIIKAETVIINSIVRYLFTYLKKMLTTAESMKEEATVFTTDLFWKAKEETSRLGK